MVWHMGINNMVVSYVIFILICGVLVLVQYINIRYARAVRAHRHPAPQIANWNFKNYFSKTLHKTTGTKPKNADSVCWHYLYYLYCILFIVVFCLFVCCKICWMSCIYLERERKRGWRRTTECVMSMIMMMMGHYQHHCIYCSFLFFFCSVCV